MELSDKIYRIIKKISGDLDDKVWDYDEMRYIEKEYIFIKPTTKFFTTSINAVQIISKLIACIIDINLMSCIQIVLSSLSIILLHLRLKKNINDEGKKYKIAWARELMSLVLFGISILIIFL